MILQSYNYFLKLSPFSSKQYAVFASRFRIPYPLAFIVMDAQENYFLIGAKEKPYPIVEITKGLSPDANVNDIKVTFSRRKSLIPCSI